MTRRPDDDNDVRIFQSEANRAKYDEITPPEAPADEE